MNKQLTKKTIGIAASAALIASLAVSGSAFAGKNDNNGQKGSIELFSVCYLEGTSLRVETDITNTSSNPADLELTEITVTAVEKYQGTWKDDNWNYVGDPSNEALPDMSSGAAHVQSTFDLCDAGSAYGPVSLLARSVNAEIKVMITDHKIESGFIARCSDDPDTEEDEVALLNIGNQTSKNGVSFCNL